MLTVTSAAELARQIAKLKKAGKTIGFVPTMGYLHDGHLALVRKAKTECAAVVVSIFVNPRQFGPNEDFAEYPRDLARDENLLRSAQTDILFAPSVEEIYPPAVRTLRAAVGLSSVACGLSRPGHFDGVVTVVARLFDLVKPDKAYFGQKDYQQLRIIQKMTETEKYPVEIIACPIVREADGLALSSRNKYLTDEQRAQSLALSRALRAAAELLKRDGTLAEARVAMLEILRDVKIDYIEFLARHNLERLTEYRPSETVILLAAELGGTRLIDNIEV